MADANTGLGPLPLKKNAPLVVALLFFLVCAAQDALQRTLTWPTIFFGACVAIMLARRPGRRPSSVAGGSVKVRQLPTGLTCTAEGLTYVDGSGRTHGLDWADVHKVSWSEPDLGYLGGEPYWTVFGEHVCFDVEGAWDCSEGDLFPSWLAKALPGFDAAVVDKARASGYFRTDSPETLVCWRRGA